MSLSFTVYGTPAPQGSKRHVGKGVMVESSKRVKPWREAVKQAALDERERVWHQRYEGPVSAEILFFFDRPKSAPKRVTRPATRSSGDIDKLLRATLDALCDAGVFRDDAQIVTVVAQKCFTHSATPSARIWIGETA